MPAGIGINNSKIELFKTRLNCVFLLFIGTKVMCREAGCGCCVVSVTLHDLSTGKDVTVAVNSVRELSSFL